MKKNLLSQQANMVMMVRPAFFGYNAETAASNAFQQDIQEDGAGNIYKQAIREFDAVVAVLKAAGIGVLVFQNSAVDTPDAIFPNNWFSTHHDGTVVLYPMLTPNRRRERNSGLLQLLQEQFLVKKWMDLSTWEEHGKYLEGTGSLVFDHVNRMAYAVLSPRTDVEVLAALCKEINYDFFCFHCEDANGNPVYHTNVVMHIGEGYVMYCEEGIPSVEERRALKERLQNSGRVLLRLSLQQMNAFCGNMLQLKDGGGHPVTVCSRTAFDQLTEEQRNRLNAMTTMVIVSIPTIERVGGGGVRCMLAELFLETKLVEG